MDAAPVHWSSVGGDAIVGGHVDGLIDGTKGIVFPGTAVDGHGLLAQFLIHKWSTPSFYKHN